MYVTVPNVHFVVVVGDVDVGKEKSRNIGKWEISVGISAVWSFQFVHREEW